MYLKSLIKPFIYLSFLTKLIYALQTDCDTLSDLYKEFETESKISWPEHSTECCSVQGITCKNDRIVSINLQRQGFKGKISEKIGLFSELTFLDLRYNEISGTIPDTISSLPKLTSLNFGANFKINGSIPKALCSLDSLSNLYLYQNELSGTIPECLGSLPKLEELCLDSNKLTGHIPSSIGKLSKLKHLDLENNKLSGIIPENFSKLDKLEIINLQGNEDLIGELPEIKNVNDCSYANTSLCVKDGTKTCHNNLRKCEAKDTEKVLEYNKTNSKISVDDDVDDDVEGDDNKNDNDNPKKGKSGSGSTVITIILLLLLLILIGVGGFFLYKRSKKGDDNNEDDNSIKRSQSKKTILPFRNEPSIQRLQSQRTEKSFIVLSPKLEEETPPPKLTLDDTIFNYVDVKNNKGDISLNEDSKMSKSSVGIKTQEASI